MLCYSCLESLGVKACWFDVKPTLYVIKTLILLIRTALRCDSRQQIHKAFGANTRGTAPLVFARVRRDHLRRARTQALASRREMRAAQRRRLRQDLPASRSTQNAVCFGGRAQAWCPGLAGAPRRATCASTHLVRVASLSLPLAVPSGTVERGVTRDGQMHALMNGIKALLRLNAPHVD